MSDLQHGTVAGYKYRGCRCAECRRASVRYEKGRRWLVHQGLTPTVPAHGFKRRIYALMAIGWTQKELAHELGIATGNLSAKLRLNETVRRATHEATAEVFERLCMTPRHSIVARRTARIAARRGWPPPLAWDDIDDPNEQPIDWHHVSDDRAEALREMDAMHLGISEVCKRLKLRRDTLEKWCARHDLTQLYSRLVDRETPHYWRNGRASGGAA